MSGAYLAVVCRPLGSVAKFLVRATVRFSSPQSDEPAPEGPRLTSVEGRWKPGRLTVAVLASACVHGAVVAALLLRPATSALEGGATGNAVALVAGEADGETGDREDTTAAADKGSASAFEIYEADLIASDAIASPDTTVTDTTAEPAPTELEANLEAEAEPEPLADADVKPLEEPLVEPATEPQKQPEPVPAGETVARAPTPPPTPTPTPTAKPARAASLEEPQSAQPKAAAQPSPPAAAGDPTTAKTSEGETDTAALAAPAGGAPGSGEGAGTGSGDGSGDGTALASAKADYTARLLAWLARHKNYPREARRQGVEGTAMLYLLVDGDGSVVTYRLQESSRSDLLDTAVLAMVDRAQPLPRPPKALEQEELALVIPVQFFLD